MNDGIEIRPFRTIEEFRACVDLQEETWGLGFSERVPPAILNVGQRLGGVSAGAYDPSGRLVGFVFGLTGFIDGVPTHWSDMLAVRPGLRDAGLGRRLKAYQREELLARGVERMHWTFDPLQSRNAHLNLTRLGAVVREYVENMYGDTDSPLHRGVGTDRFVALWEMTSPRVRERFENQGGSPSAALFDDAPVALAAELVDGRSVPGSVDPDIASDSVRVFIPSDIGRFIEEDPELAREWRLATRSAFSVYLGRGYEVREFLRGDSSSSYLLARIGS